MIRALFPIMVAACFLAACATLWMSQEERLRARATGFWEALKAGDLVALYDFEEISKKPGASLQKYVQSKGGIRYLSYQIQSIRFLSPNEAEVVLAVEYVVPPTIPRPVKSEIRDLWVRIDGTWYHAVRKPALLRRGA